MEDTSNTSLGMASSDAVGEDWGSPVSPPDAQWLPPAGLARSVAEWIEDGIMRGELRHGERVKEAEIAKNLKISRSPVREAILSLTERGLLTHQARVGAIVNEFSERTIGDVYELRAVIESWVLTDSVPNLGSAQLDEVREHLRYIHENRENIDGGRQYGLGWELRKKLYAGCRNEMALITVSSLRNRLARLPVLLRNAEGFSTRWLHAHDTLLKEVDAGRVQSAADELHSFLEYSGEEACRQLRKLNITNG